MLCFARKDVAVEKMALAVLLDKPKVYRAVIHVWDNRRDVLLSGWVHPESMQRRPEGQTDSDQGQQRHEPPIRFLYRLLRPRWRFNQLHLVEDLSLQSAERPGIPQRSPIDRPAVNFPGRSVEMSPTATHSAPTRRSQCVDERGMLLWL